MDASSNAGAAATYNHPPRGFFPADVGASGDSNSRWIAGGTAAPNMDPSATNPNNNSNANNNSNSMRDPNATANVTGTQRHGTSGGVNRYSTAISGGGSSVLVTTSASGHQKMYDTGKVLGNGSFGIVCEARCLESGEQVAIKKVLQDPRYKNRELDIMRELRHPNIVELKDYFYTESTEREGDRYLNVVMEHIPETVYRVMKTFVRNSQSMPMILVKLYAYQMCRSLGYLHSLGICHRDIKPQNLLVDSRTHVLKLCDFGSAKRLTPGESSVAYICSRFYRAPELMLGATEYATAIDIWSIGCVLGELLLGRPLFAGETSVDQLVKIISILGTPTRRQMSAMNPHYTEFRFPDVRPKDWRKVFSSNVPDTAVDLLSSFLKFEPSERLHPLTALSHPFFDELRDPNAKLPGGNPFPDLFRMTEQELREMCESTLRAAIPAWALSQRPYNSGTSNYNISASSNTNVSGSNSGSSCSNEGRGP